MGRTPDVTPRLVQTDPPIQVKDQAEADRLKAAQDERIRRLAHPDKAGDPPKSP